MLPATLQPEAVSRRHSPAVRLTIAALAAAVVLAGVVQHSPPAGSAAAGIPADTGETPPRGTALGVPSATVLLACEMDGSTNAAERRSDRDAAGNTACPPGAILDAPGHAAARLAGAPDVTHDVAECARRGMRTAGRHPPQ